MEPASYQVGRDVYRAATVRGDLPAFDSAWGAVGRALSLSWQCLPTILKATLPFSVPLSLVNVLPASLHAVAILPLALALVAFQAYLPGAITHVAWQRMRGRAVPAREAIRVGGRLWWPMLRVNVRCDLYLLAGWMCMVVPAFYWLGKYALAAPATYFEPTLVRSRDALTRSGELTRGRVWQVTGTLLLAFAPYLAKLTISSVATLALLGPYATVAVRASVSVTSWLVMSFVWVVQMVIYLGIAGAPAEDPAWHLTPSGD